MSIHRRQFVQTALGAAAVMTLSKRRARATETSDIRVAQIGFRGRGMGHIESIRNNIAAICDVDQEVLQGGIAYFRGHGLTIDAYADYRKLLERQDIDAVSIATPNHTHALIAIAAAQAGKDVYVEKPVSHNVWEGRQLVAAARRYGRIIQAGTQSRSSAAMKEAVAFVQGGGLGAIRHAIGACYKPRTSIGKLDKPLIIPESIDYELWCGPAQKESLFRNQLHYDWHWDFNTGCGDLGNQGIHQMDIARWFLGEASLAPRVFSVGGRFGYDDAGNTPNTQLIFYGYEKAPLIFEVRGLPRARQFHDESWPRSMDKYRGVDIGVIVQCEKGYVVVPNYVEATAYDNQGRVVRKWQSGESSHHDNWLQAVAARDPKLLAAEIYDGHVSSALCHLGNVSYRIGKKAPFSQVAEQVAANELLANAFDRMTGHLRANGVDVEGDKGLTSGEWLQVDPATDAFTDSDAATELRAREYRAPFIVPEIERDLTGQAVSAV